MDLSETKNLPKVDHTPAVLDEPARLLLKAANLIEKHGWCQSNYRTSDGRLCILGAVKTAAGIGMHGRHADAEEAVMRVVGTLGPFILIWNWNDAKGRTKEEVVAKLRAVALRLL